MNVSERYDRDLGPPQHVLDATQGLLEHRLANKLWSSADDDRHRADVLVDGTNDPAARVARIGPWRSQDMRTACVRPMRAAHPAPNSCLARKKELWRPVAVGEVTYAQPSHCEI